jgi:mannose PTS system EIIA component
MKNKVGGVILSHGLLANELLAAAETVVGEINFIASVPIGWHDDVEVSRADLARAIEQVRRDNGVILLTDMFGGTPTNIAAMFLAEKDVEILTGVNLPMIVKLAQQEDDWDLSETARQVLNAGRSGIHQAGELLVPLKSK